MNNDFRYMKFIYYWIKHFYLLNKVCKLHNEAYPQSLIRQPHYSPQCLPSSWDLLNILYLVINLSLLRQAIISRFWKFKIRLSEYCLVHECWNESSCILFWPSRVSKFPRVDRREGGEGIQRHSLRWPQHISSANQGTALGILDLNWGTQFD